MTIDIARTACIVMKALLVTCLALANRAGTALAIGIRGRARFSAATAVGCIRGSVHTYISAYIKACSVQFRFGCRNQYSIKVDPL